MENSKFSVNGYKFTPPAPPFFFKGEVLEYLVDFTEGNFLKTTVDKYNLLFKKQTVTLKSSSQETVGIVLGCVEKRAFPKQ